MSNELERVNVEHVSVEQRNGVRMGLGAKVVRGVGLMVGAGLLVAGLFGGGIGDAFGGVTARFDELANGMDDTFVAPVNETERELELQSVVGMVPEVLDAPGVEWFAAFERTETDGEWVRVEGRMVGAGTEYGVEGVDGVVRQFVVEQDGLLLRTQLKHWAAGLGEKLNTVEVDEEWAGQFEGEDGRLFVVTVVEGTGMFRKDTITLDVRTELAQPVEGENIGGVEL